LPLAYLLEGTFTSYFKGKPMPEKPVEKEEGEADEPKEEAKTDLSQITEKGAFREKSSRARIFIVASAEVVKDQLLDEDGRSTNAVFVLNMIDALNGREPIAAMRNKVQQSNPLEETTPATKTMVKTVNIVGLPILVVGFGLLVWMRRHTRRKRIQMQFHA
jgi:ABC-type uncharacterized transport system involved in gliding motility auxiliary subunit